ncbi:hypothetical protein JCM10914A_25440 [Paenibacillus sp. JCM 10914]|uniref:hypothetical protein n=1 Tax=Paenibacillus sp. JCM 10914 TaxID=1236974 RepID=UPI0003CCA5CA|nr:hypothetical protein [Paenibacillus sp. JCM 10914]GAE09539.1 hypothetical protein JCM10914_5903 [Paenibacillus sp. JCM 10914]
MSTEMSGLAGLNEERLSEIRENVSRLSEMKQEVPVEELFSEPFVQRHTPFLTIDELLETAGYQGDTDEDFDQFIQNDKIDPFIAGHTSFENWQAFQEKAVASYIAKWIGL